MSQHTILDLEGNPLVINAEDTHCGSCRWRSKDHCGVFKKWLVNLGVWIRLFECAESEKRHAKKEQE